MSSIPVSSIRRMGMGIVIIGGLLFSLTLTLYVIPAMYSYLARKHKVVVEEVLDEKTYHNEGVLVTAND